MGSSLLDFFSLLASSNKVEDISQASYENTTSVYFFIASLSSCICGCGILLKRVPPADTIQLARNQRGLNALCKCMRVGGGSVRGLKTVSWLNLATITPFSLCLTKLSPFYFEVLFINVRKHG